MVALLKRAFGIDIEHCPQCGDTLKIIAAIEEPAVIVRTRPAHARRCFMRVVGRISARFLRCARHNRGAQPRVGASAP